jgi:hypothetical protein
LLLNNSLTSIAQRHEGKGVRPLKSVAALLTFLIFCLTFPAAVTSQTQVKEKLPSADKIVDKYLRSIGGKKRIAAVRDAVFDWRVNINDEAVGVASTKLKAPSSSLMALTLPGGQVISAANSSSAWFKGLDGQVRTLTGMESGAAKLRSILDARQLLDYKKSNVAARVVPSGAVESESTFVVEFSTRAGAKLVYHFSKTTGLILRIDDHARGVTTRFSDYRPELGLMQPHRVQIRLPGAGDITLVLEKARYNQGIAVTVFDAPAAEPLNVADLLRTVGRNQEEVEKRFTEYSFRQKEIDRQINSKGEIKKETVKEFEVFPIANREPILKLISENGVPLSPERAAKEEKRVQEEFLKAERDREKDEAREQKRKAERLRRNTAKGEDQDDDVAISQFLKVCEFVSPRRERFRDREAVVFDFRPRPGFKPSNRQEDLISKLVGVVWIDPADKQVIRLEARLAEGFKMAGGLLLSLRPGATLVMEQTRMDEGVWLPRLAQINLSIKVLLFGGGDMNKTYEWSDYRHFKGDVSDYKIETPKAEVVEPEKKP